MNKRETHIVTGMTRDLATSRFEPAYVYDAHNIRIRVVNGDSTLLSVTNEKGTEEFEISNSNATIRGTIIGSASFTNTLVLFTVYDNGQFQEDYIYRIDFDEAFDVATLSILFDGYACVQANNIGLNFSIDHPIEALAVYENENIQKVYWVDGINQPRMINICKGEQSLIPDAFDFNREIGVGATIEVVKYNSGGEFRPGTIQYCFNYFNKFGQETNIVDVSPLYYISPKDSGLAADDVSGCSFQITLKNLNTDFEYVRLYAIYRSSENAPASVRIVGDYKTSTVKDTALWENDEDLDPFTFSNAYVYDINTGREIYRIQDVYEAPEPYTSLEIPLSLTEAVYISDTNYLYAGYYIRGGAKSDYIMMFNDDAGIHFIRNNPNISIKRTQFIDRYVEQVSIIDTGTYGSTIDSEALLFVGGQYIIADTLAEKDNTLFLGNLKNIVPNIGDIKITSSYGDVKIRDIRDINSILHLTTISSQEFDYNGNPIDSTIPDSQITIYQTNTEKEDAIENIKDNNRSSQCIKTFKARENYRLGFIAQYKTGQWSEVVWLDDCTEEFASGKHHFFSNMENGQMLWGQQFRGAGFKSTIDSSVVNALYEKDFIKVAPVVVYPSIADRLVVCQGLLCPTLFSSRDRNENAPYAQADWRFRVGYNWNRVKDEVQLNATKDDYAPAVPFGYYSSSNQGPWNQLTGDDFTKYFPTEYYRDPNFLTFHSPDLESSDELRKDDFEGVSLRLVGFSNNGFKTYYDNQHSTYNTVERETPNTKVFTHIDMDTLGFGDASNVLIDNNGNEGYLSDNLLFKGFYDNIIGEKEDSDGNIQLTYRLSIHDDPTRPDQNYYTYYTYLWHRNGSLNSQDAVSSKFASQGGIRTATYRRKVFSIKTLSYTTYFNRNCDFSALNTIDVPLKDVGLFDTDQASMITVDTANQEDRRYYGNIDVVLVNGFPKFDNKYFYDASITASSAHAGVDYSEGYPIRYTNEPINDGRTIRRVPGIGWTEAALNIGKDPVQIKYKTTRHIVTSLDSSSSAILSEIGTEIQGSQYIYWLNQSLQLEGYALPTNYYTSIAPDETLDYSFRDKCVYIGELYRNMTPEKFASRFGGSTQEALISNVWTLAGQAISLVSGQDAVLYFTEGDTYFGRYECLKSYPYTQEDRQSIVSIYSTELESRVNLDFRYGNTMNLDDNTLVTPQNFNLYNHPGYEQTNQYFTYKAIDYDRYLDQDFPNMITWSLEKTLGEDVDTWTSIPMTSTLDLDGTKGEITKLVRFNNEIIAFQDTGFAQILFNSRVQIPVSDGQPIEITNGYKVDGKRYISESIGMSNKWSLAVTPYALYFADDSKNNLYAYNGQLTDLSSTKGMKSWMYDKGNNFRPVWNPKDYGNLRTFYDKIYGDVYFTTKNTSLVYSEPLGNFASFMDYGGVTSMNNMGNKFLSFTTDGEDNTKMWEMWEGDYNMFFGEYKPYWMTFIANSDPTMDKVFNSLEWRCNTYDKDGNFLPYGTFDTMRIWHEHQDTGCVNLKDDIGIPSSLKKKFNAFRAYVPRDVKGAWSIPNMQRIRNPWTYIRLAKTEENTDQMVFTDLNVDFFE